MVKLDRSVDRPVLPMAGSSAVYIGMPLGVIGHPSGLPQKIADGGRVKSLLEEGEYFVSSLDVFAGSSGSPVISLESYQVVGMLVGGEQDYWLTDGGCYTVKQCAGNGEDCSGELIFNLSSLDLLLSVLFE